MKAVVSVILSLFLIVPASASDGDITIGIASWYGYPFHGRHAANGEVYDMEKLTAAHRTLAFGTRVRVINLHNERSVEVRITDRGPFIDGRIIDLSHAAAQAVDMVAPGITPVRLEIIGPVTNDPTARFAVQVGAFRVRRNAERCLAVLHSRYGPGHITLREGDPDLWRVLVGAEHSEEAARELAARIRLESAQPGSFIARLD
jgi:rare lipoprotein A